MNKFDLIPPISKAVMGSDLYKSNPMITPTYVKCTSDGNAHLSLTYDRNVKLFIYNNKGKIITTSIKNDIITIWA